MKPHMIYQVDETRERILAAARDMFTKQGLQEVQMQDVAKSVDISRASLYRYYEDKFDLALGVLAVIWKELNDDWNGRKDAILAEGKTALDRLELYLKEFWLSPRYGAQLRFLAEFDAFYSGARIPENFVERLRSIFTEDSIEFLARTLEEGIEDASVRGDVNPRIAGITVLNAVRGLQQRLTLRSHALLETGGREEPTMTDELVRILIDGLANKQGRP
ncbi:MAG TPA: TetR/AcrR family transcriptional regulator [Treponemataceae bacterium]|nr:TetR/AcrR family transcriptional regulator [Treponemataceae bacterium]